MSALKRPNPRDPKAPEDRIDSRLGLIVGQIVGAPANCIGDQGPKAPNARSSLDTDHQVCPSHSLFNSLNHWKESSSRTDINMSWHGGGLNSVTWCRKTPEDRTAGTQFGCRRIDAVRWTK